MCVGGIGGVTQQNPPTSSLKLTHHSPLTTPPTDNPQGIGFVEFERHDHALAALRQLNNHPAVFGPERRPIIEFAIENVKVG